MAELFDDIQVKRSFEAADGYFHLGMIEDAQKELEAIPTRFQNAPEVMQMRLRITMRQGNWADALSMAMHIKKLRPKWPFPYLDAAYCLHELNQTVEARDTLNAGPSELRNFPIFYYNMACYEACLGNLPEARKLLKKAIRMEPEYKEQSLNDPDLQPLFAKASAKRKSPPKKNKKDKGTSGN
jgi:predicted Zn-dependent protease